MKKTDDAAPDAVAQAPAALGYPDFHQDRGNLAIHMLAVPWFIAGTLGAVWSLAGGNWLRAAALAGLPLASIALQGLGHKRERNPPLPFSGPGNVLRRVLVEQFFMFPLFALRGGWLAAWRRGSAADRE